MAQFELHRKCKQMDLCVSKERTDSVLPKSSLCMFATYSDNALEVALGQYIDFKRL